MDIPDSAKPDPETPGSGANFQSYAITSGVANGTTYRYRLRAVNAVGAGPPSAAFIGRPVAASGSNTVMATQVTATVNGWDGVSTLNLNRKFLTYFEFGEEVRGFTPSDVSVTNGHVARVLVEQASQRSTTRDPNQIHASKYAVDIQPEEAGLVTVSLPAGKVFSAAGNGNLASNELTYNYVVSTVRPQALITGPVSDCAATGNGFCVVVAFHDKARDIPVRGFEAKDLRLSNGDVASLVPREHTGYAVLDDNNEAVQFYSVWDAVIQPRSGYTGAFTLSILAGKVRDYSGNLNLYAQYITTVTSGSGQQTGGATRSPIAGFTLFDNANGGADVQALTEGAKLAALSSGRLNIRAEVASGAEIGSVRMELTGQRTSARTEGIAPYALFGDYGGRAFPAGTYTVTATPYPERNLGGTSGPARSVTFTVAAGAGAAPTVTVTSAAEGPVSGEFAVTVTFSEPVSGFRRSELVITNGQATRMASIVDGTGYGTEHEVYVAPNPDASGEVTITVSAGVAADADGNPNTASAAFTIAIASVWDSLTGFTLFDNADGGADVRALTDGTVLRGLVSGRLNVRANTRSGASIGSVRMTLSGAMSSSRTEGIAPYALFGDRDGRVRRGRHRRDHRLHGDAQSVELGNGDGGLRHVGRHGEGGRGLHVRKRHADLRARRDLEERLRPGAGRCEGRGRGDLHAAFEQRLGGDARGRGGDRHHYEHRPDVQGVARALRAHGRGAGRGRGERASRRRRRLARHGGRAPGRDVRRAGFVRSRASAPAGGVLG